jgi:rhamnose transport system permease protein
MNSLNAPNYLTIGNQINLFTLSIEKVIVALTMTFLIINGEIDLSAPSIMGLAACLAAYLFSHGMDMVSAVMIALLVGVAAGLFNGFWIANRWLELPGGDAGDEYRFPGLARVLLEDRSIGKFPDWFNTLGQKPLLGPFPLIPADLLRPVSCCSWSSCTSRASAAVFS